MSDGAQDVGVTVDDKRQKLTKEERAARSAAWRARREAAAERRRLKEARDLPRKAIRAAAQRRIDEIATRAEPDAATRRQTRDALIAETKLRVRDVIDVRQPQQQPTGKPKPVAPTPEQMRHGDFDQQSIYDSSADGKRQIGYAYRRKAHYKSLPLTLVQYRTIGYYRAVFDETERSEVKSQLDIRLGGGGGGDAALTRIEEMASAAEALRRIDRRIRKAWLPTLRAVVLQDMSFTAVALSRYGGRERTEIDVSKRKPTVKRKLVLRSNAHRDQISREFYWALDELVAAVMPWLSSTNRAVERAALSQDANDQRAVARAVQNVESIAAAVDPEFLDDNGFMRSWDEIRAIIIERMAPAV